MRLLILTISALCAFGQAMTPLKVGQSSGSLTGQVWLQERNSNGTNWLKLEAPQSIASDFSLILPNAPAASNGLCFKGNTDGTHAYGACEALWTVSGSDVYRSSGNVGIDGTPVERLHIKGGSGANSIAIDNPTAASTFYLQSGASSATLITSTAIPLILATNFTGRWVVDGGGTFYPIINDTYDIGFPGTRVRGLYAGFVEAYKSGGTASSDYVMSRKFTLLDQTGGSGAWDFHSSGSMAATSAIKIRDNAGSRWLEGWRATGGSPLNFTSVFSNWVPAKRDTGGGDAVTDSVFPDLGGSSARWATAYLGILDASSSNTLVPNGTASLGASGNDWNRLWVGGAEVTSFVRPQVDNGGTSGTSSKRWSTVYSYAGDFAGLLTATGGFTAPVNSYITNGASFVMDRASRTINQKAYWTVAGNSATTGAWSTGTTPSGGQSSWVIDHNGTQHLVLEESGLLNLSAGLIVGANLTVTGTATAARFNATGGNSFRVSSVDVIDSSRNLVNIGTANISGVLTLGSTITGNLSPTIDGGGDLGITSLKWAHVYVNTAEIYAVIQPDTNNSRNNGASTRRWATTYTQNLNISGTVTAPSGSTGLSTTITVRNSAGTGTCTLTVSGGLITATTC